MRDVTTCAPSGGVARAASSQSRSRAACGVARAPVGRGETTHGSPVDRASFVSNIWHSSVIAVSRELGQVSSIESSSRGGLASCATDDATDVPAHWVLKRLGCGCVCSSPGGGFLNRRRWRACRLRTGHGARSTSLAGALRQASRGLPWLAKSPRRLRPCRLRRRAVVVRRAACDETRGARCRAERTLPSSTRGTDDTCAQRSES